MTSSASALGSVLALLAFVGAYRRARRADLGVGGAELVFGLHHVGTPQQHPAVEPVGRGIGEPGDGEVEPAGVSATWRLLRRNSATSSSLP